MYGSYNASFASAADWAVWLSIVASDGLAFSGRCYKHCHLWRQTLEGDCALGCDVVHSGRYVLNKLL
jgi:hypothetical protein